MQDFLLSNANWITTAHVISVISWMAAQLYLPRLFVYHVDAVPGGELSETLKIMERRLLKAIMTPAMISTLLFGFLLVYAKPSLASELWFHIKMLGILVLIGVHGYSAKTVRLFADDKNTKTAKFYRILNEIPTVAMILAIICVIALRKYPGFL